MSAVIIVGLGSMGKRRIRCLKALGNYDIVGNNLPIFFIRDAIKFPDMVHSLKPSPETNKQDPNRFFDFFSNVPEATHMLTRLYTDLGIPRLPIYEWE